MKKITRFMCFIFILSFSSTLLLADDDDGGGNTISPSLDGTVLYFESTRMLLTTELNGKVLENGFSFSGWFHFIRFPAESGDIIIGNEFSITYQGENSVHLHLKDTGTNIDGLEMGAWNNFAVTYDLSNVNFFLNGSLVAHSVQGILISAKRSRNFSTGRIGIPSNTFRFKRWRSPEMMKSTPASRAQDRNI